MSLVCINVLSTIAGSGVTIVLIMLYDIVTYSLLEEVVDAFGIFLNFRISKCASSYAGVDVVPIIERVLIR